MFPALIRTGVRAAIQKELKCLFEECEKVALC